MKVGSGKDKEVPSHCFLFCVLSADLLVSSFISCPVFKPNLETSFEMSKLSILWTNGRLDLSFGPFTMGPFELIMRWRLASSPFVFVLLYFSFFPSSRIMFTVELSLLGDSDKKITQKKTLEEGGGARIAHLYWFALS